jgi:transcriptional regulator with XRE-family HTH domain
MNSQQRLGKLVKELREERDWTLGQLAQKAKTSVSYLSRIENGKINKPSGSYLSKLATAFGVPVERLHSAAGYEPRGYHYEPLDDIKVIAKRPLSDADKQMIRAVIRAMTSNTADVPTVG